MTPKKLLTPLKIKFLPIFSITSTAWKNQQLIQTRSKNLKPSMIKKLKLCSKIKKLTCECKWIKSSMIKIWKSKKWLLSSKRSFKEKLSPQQELKSITSLALKTISKPITLDCMRLKAITVLTVTMFLGKQIFGRYYPNTKRKNSMKNKPKKLPTSSLKSWWTNLKNNPYTETLTLASNFPTNSMTQTERTPTYPSWMEPKESSPQKISCPKPPLIERNFNKISQ